MAFFKFRKGGDEHATAPAAPAPESLEAMRKRARHRLIGAAILVLLGVIGFPLLFDSQPRPIAVDISIEIPDKDKTTPLRSAAPSVAAAVRATAKPEASALASPVGSEPVVAAPAVPASRVAGGSISSPAMITESDTKPVSKPESKPITKSADKASDKTPEKTADKVPAHEPSKAPVVTDARDTDKKSVAAEGRFVVQVGAFSDVIKAREARVKLEKAGLKTYTQVIESKEGRRIRVRVGPFATKHDAEKAAEKIKKLDLPTGILEL